MLIFSIANAFRRKGIAILAIAGVGLGTALMTVLLSVSAGVEQRFTNTVSRAGGDIIVSAYDAPLGGLIGGGTPLPAAYLDRLRTADRVSAVIPTVAGPLPKGALRTDTPFGVTFTGVSLTDQPGGPSAEGPMAHIVEGRGLGARNEVIVGAQIDDDLRLLGGTPIRPGDQLQVPRRTNGEPIQLSVVGIFRTNDALVDRGIYGDIGTARELLGLSGDAVTVARVEVDQPEDVQPVADELRSIFQQAQPAVQIMVSGQALADLSVLLGVLDRFLLAISLVAVVTGGISILLIMLASVTERMREFGILKAAGWSNGNIVISVVVESLTLAIFGADAGFALGAAVVAVLRGLMGVDMVLLTPRLVLEVGLLALFVGVVGGLYPAIRAARVSPIEAMRGA